MVIVVVFVVLIYVYVVLDFLVLNVVLNSYLGKLMFYKVIGVWVNYEGFMLLWMFILVLFSLLIVFFGKIILVSMWVIVFVV